MLFKQKDNDDKLAFYVIVKESVISRYCYIEIINIGHFVLEIYLDCFTTYC